jgi:hypothetical protein
MFRKTSQKLKTTDKITGKKVWADGAGERF